MTFQSRVREWLNACFSRASVGDKQERMHRFLEEALELAQATGCSKREALELVDYVFARKIGDAGQEVGGVMVTLAGLCDTANVDLESAAEAELGPELAQDRTHSRQADWPPSQLRPARNSDENRGPFHETCRKKLFQWWSFHSIRTLCADAVASMTQRMQRMAPRTRTRY